MSDLTADRAEQAELEMLRERDLLLRHYLGTIANKVGRPTNWDALSWNSRIEHIGEGLLAELERREATVNSELKVQAPRLSENVEWERYQRGWGRPLSEHDQAQLDALQTRMETEERAR